MTFTELVVEHYLPLQGDLSPVTCKNIASHLGDATGRPRAKGAKAERAARYALLPVLGAMELSTIGPQDVRLWQAGLVREHYQRSSILAKRALLRAILELARVNGWLDLNPGTSSPGPLPGPRSRQGGVEARGSSKAATCASASTARASNTTRSSRTGAARRSALGRRAAFARTSTTAPSPSATFMAPGPPPSSGRTCTAATARSTATPPVSRQSTRTLCERPRASRHPIRACAARTASGGNARGRTSRANGPRARSATRPPVDTTAAGTATTQAAALTRRLPPPAVMEPRGLAMPRARAVRPLGTGSEARPEHASASGQSGWGRPALCRRGRRTADVRGAIVTQCACSS